jgi:hypothetical protein
VLPLGGPRDQVVAKKHAIVGGGATSFRTTRPIRIGVGDVPVRR